MAEQKLKITDLRSDSMNANAHSKKGNALLQKSIKENKLGRSILISADNTVIAGNGVLSQAQAADIKNVRVIETKGDEIIAVKRTDIKDNTPEFFKMALADNVVAQHNITLNTEIVKAIAVKYDVKEWDKEVKPVEQSINHRVTHNQATGLTLKFASPAQLAEVKKKIIESGQTVEMVVLKALGLA
jgi:hypothetical protein